MASFTETITQSLTWPKADIPPGNYASNTNTLNGGWLVGPLNMAQVKRAVGRVSAGVITGSSCTVTATFIACSVANTSAAGWAAVSGGPTVTLNSNVAGTIEMRADQMPAGTQYLCLCVNNNCAALFSAELFGGQAEQSPASQYNANTTYLVQSVMTGPA